MLNETVETLTLAWKVAGRVASDELPMTSDQFDEIRRDLEDHWRQNMSGLTDDEDLIRRHSEIPDEASAPDDDENQRMDAMEMRRLLIPEFAAADAVEPLLSLIRELPDEHERWMFHHELIESLAEAGQLPLARDLVPRLFAGEPWDRIKARLVIAQSSGDVTDLDILRLMVQGEVGKHPGLTTNPSAYFAEIWSISREPSDLAQAKLFALNLADPLPRSWALSAIACRTGRAEDFLDAFRSVRAVRGEAALSQADSLMTHAWVGLHKAIHSPDDTSSVGALSRDDAKKLIVALGGINRRWARELERRLREFDLL